MPNIFKNIRYYIKHRLYDPKDIIKIRTLEKGYHDPCERLLHGAFSILVDFVEVELSWMSIWCEDRRKKLSFMDYWKAKLFGILRSEKLGREYLEWEKSLHCNEMCEPGCVEHCNSQAEHAVEVEILYNWWKNERPNRKDPMDISGLGDFFDKHRSQIFLFRPSNIPGCSEMYDTLTPEEKSEERRLLDECHRIEEAQHQEDEDMFVKLVKIRRGLWT